MRLISFAMTKESFVDGSKTVTRRLGWKALQKGAILMGVEKAQGLKRGEKPVHLGALEVLDVRREPLYAIGQEPDGTAREGLGHLLQGDFIEHFCKAMKCKPDAIVTRIEFRRIPDGDLRLEPKNARECEDCGDETKRRTRCPRCKLLVCSWCWGHVHGNTGLAQAVRGKAACS